MNSTFAQTYSSCAYFLRCLTDPDLPMNAGFYEAIRVIAPEGTVANAVHPAAVVGGLGSLRALDRRVLEGDLRALPDRVCRRGKVDDVSRRLRRVRPPPHKDARHYYCFLETWRAGMAAGSGKTGPTPCRPIRRTPKRARRGNRAQLPGAHRALRAYSDSDGPGEFRGGLGLRRDYCFPDHEPTFTILADRRKFPPKGLFGGGPGDWRTTP